MKKRQNISALFTIAVFYLILESVFGITCPILFLTGISCAGCGMSRAWFCVCLLYTSFYRFFSVIAAALKTSESPEVPKGIFWNYKQLPSSRTSPEGFVL